MSAAYDSHATEVVPDSTQIEAAIIPDAPKPAQPLPAAAGTTEPITSVVAAPLWEAHLLARFLAISGNPPLDAESGVRCLNAIKLMGSCGYAVQDICVVWAHASVYFSDVLARRGRHVPADEASTTIVALVYIAHSYVLDDTCPLSLWHRHLASEYCALKVFDAAVVRLMKMRGYMLRVGQQDMQRRCDVFLRATTTLRLASTMTAEHDAAGGN